MIEREEKEKRREEKRREEKRREEKRVGFCLTFRNQRDVSQELKGNNLWLDVTDVTIHKE